MQRGGMMAMAFPHFFSFGFTGSLTGVRLPLSEDEILALGGLRVIILILELSLHDDSLFVCEMVFFFLKKKVNF